MGKTAIEGLHVMRGFLGLAERQAATRAAVILSGQAQLQAAASRFPDTISPAHNVNSQEKFKSLSLALEDGRTAQCEHFSDYATGGAGGGGGHRLTYFRKQIPSPGVPDLVERLSALQAVQNEAGGRETNEFPFSLAADEFPFSLSRRPPLSLRLPR